jgi:hypothetical protein
MKWWRNIEEMQMPDILKYISIKHNWVTDIGS